jgi:hypothetical protein
LPQYRFRRVEIKRNLGIAVFPQEHPPRATAEFNVVVELDVPQLQIQDRRIPRYVEVTFRRDQDGQWRVTDYRHDDPRQGFTIDRVP